MFTYKSILIYGFALFAMFFGSGNLVFPIKIGQMTGQYWLLGFCGLFITGIVLPFLGLFAVKLHKGSYTAFFAEGGSLAKLLLPLFTLSLLGSFGVVPRCITVAYGGMNYIIPQIPLEFFSVLFCLVTFFFCLKDQQMINIIGKWMGPVLLIILAALIITGAIYSDSIIEEKNRITSASALYNGFITGYQTMDLFAAFFFSSLIFAQIQKIIPPNTTAKETIRFAIKPSLVGMGLLSVIYLGLVFLGAYFSDLLTNIEPEFMLATIANHVMGRLATLVLGVVMVFSCLTTAVALNNIYARYLCSLFSLKEDKYVFVLIGTTTIAFLVSLFDFKGIEKFLVPALEVSYPSMIMLALLSIATKKLHALKIVLFYGILIMMILSHF